MSVPLLPRSHSSTSPPPEPLTSSAAALNLHLTPPYLRPWPRPPGPPIQVRPRSCCYFIDVRIGTMILAVLSFGSSLGLGVVTLGQLLTSLTSWWVAWAVLASFALWSSLAIIAVYGFLGALLKRREWVEWFYDLCWWHVWANVALGLWWLICHSMPDSKRLLISVCMIKRAVNANANALDGFSTSRIQAAGANNLQGQCQHAVQLSLIFLDFCWAIAILIELWLVLIVGHTLDELEDWDAAKLGFDLEGPVPSSKNKNKNENENDNDNENRGKTSFSTGKRSQSQRRRRHHHHGHVYRGGHAAARSLV